MANNRCVAEQRAVGLKRKLMKNKEFLEDYRRFMDSILEKGYAMEVRQDQLSRDDNRVWYVPHHEDVSLNGQLMQGPDLTNTLIDLCEGIPELLYSLRSNLAAPNGPKHNVPEMFYWV
ncbi:hypothetical protein D4764_12G0010580 [Takifugu flavidus]|uniref:Uncharacterized protein n=1 Tax=Takifugu flavidus TaxID=433684 RepID=A0A5C6PG53_9TELE|nr:hypothetical protein D4764_12G0010580 [Takifugu flavidus]